MIAEQRAYQRLVVAAQPLARGTRRGRVERGDALSPDEDVDAAMLFPTARQRGDARAVRATLVEDRSDLAGDLPPQISDVQVAEANRDRVGIVLVLGLTHEVELGAIAQACEHLLAPLERDADDLGMKGLRVGDPRKRLAPQKLPATQKRARNKRRRTRVIADTSCRPERSAGGA